MGRRVTRELRKEVKVGSLDRVRQIGLEAGWGGSVEKGGRDGGYRGGSNALGYRIKRVGWKGEEKLTPSIHQHNSTNHQPICSGLPDQLQQSW